MQNEQPQPEEISSKPATGTVGLAAVPVASLPPGGDVAAANKLTPEEQMALFEKELKENDWGHKPC